ncbi:phosphatase PAP2 family protein [Fusobacterium hwasookii]|uniref:Serine/threonine protein phosphatase n=1 Tax=Fusobacterium hwasookii ChDC F206 TaxID=1307443 RepID=A0AAC8WKH8_9FUSO|nr:phosphatase PAP2 family protein [Fusobacterium hwasookii]ALQ35769.1 serine/threonine protein phosphatase [Fusobacterium hwasookii ChDC F206]ALQ37595.1 serine/threonine protein phosphatase [Fusobacterium hwasookii ChDC F300]
MLKLIKSITRGEDFKVNKLLKLKINYTIFMIVFFVIMYKGAEFYTYTVENVPSYFMEWERNIPFLPIFMLPYMTSAPFFLVTIFFEKNEYSLKLLMKRAIFLTVVSTIIFVLFPMKFYFPKPEIENQIFKTLFHILDLLDSSFNQCPSLHVSFAFLSNIVYYREIKNRFLKYFLCFWGFLLAISVLFVYQHHFIDLLGGTILFIISCMIFQRKK